MDRLVDFSSGDIIKVHSRQLSEFMSIALSNKEKKRYRLCLQDSPENQLQDMFICRTKSDYIRPDKHEGIPESHTIIEGREAVILFSDNGDILDAYILDRENGYISYRINTGIYHLTIPITKTAIDYEVKLGPFSKDSVTYPNWAPDGRNIEEANAFMDEIIKRIGDMGII